MKEKTRDPDEKIKNKAEALSAETVILGESFEKCQGKIQGLQQEKNQIMTVLLEKQGALKVLQELLKKD